MVAGAAGAVEAGDPWPEITRECRPWAYNWWMGSAVDRDNLARELRRYRDAGLAASTLSDLRRPGRRIPRPPVPRAGMDGDVRLAVDEAERLDLGVDLTTGSGWCFGGPCITPDLAG
jgi:hypothetical protein